eukprot:gene11751-biopygen3596
MELLKEVPWDINASEGYHNCKEGKRGRRERSEGSTGNQQSGIHRQGWKGGRAGAEWRKPGKRDNVSDGTTQECWDLVKDSKTEDQETEKGKRGDAAERQSSEPATFRGSAPQRKQSLLPPRCFRLSPFLSALTLSTHLLGEEPLGKATACTVTLPCSGSAAQMPYLPLPVYKTHVLAWL